jgi:hypothetical protein
MSRWSRLRAVVSHRNGDWSSTSESGKLWEKEKENVAALKPASKTNQNSLSSESAQPTPTLPSLISRTAMTREVYGSSAGVNWDEALPDGVIPLTSDDARRLIPRYNGMAQHDMLQWHWHLCEVCSEQRDGARPCAEYFEIIGEYAEYEGYAIRGEG